MKKVTYYLLVCTFMFVFGTSCQQKTKSSKQKEDTEMSKEKDSDEDDEDFGTSKKSKKKDKASESKLEFIVEQEQAACPQEIDGGLTLQSVKDDGENIVFTYVVDESVMKIKDMKKMQKELKEAVREELYSSEVKPNIEVFVENDRGTVYKYKGSKSGDVFETVFTDAELKKILK